MATLLQLHFAFNGPFGDAMAEQLKPLAESINQEPGFLWKVWTESEKGNDSNLLIVFYVQIMPDDFVMQLHR
ncbi:YdhR family protein, partial [Escherichia coli]|uniref:YdhR family protein n=1 Tax=Escherichia coli TaxID=562 RepID=UPI00201A4EE9